MHNPDRRLPFQGLLNARDLGGYPTADGARTRWRSVLRSDDLAQLTPEGFRALCDYGIATVVDLRWLEEIALNPSPLAAGGTVIRYRHVSLLTSTPAEWRAISKGCEKEFWKCVVLERAQPQLREVLQAIAAAPPAPLLFHCVAGKDRTGLVAALLLALADVEPEAIAQDYSASTRLLSDPYLKRYADVDPADVLENVRCPEAGVHNMLAFLKSQGGIRTYLRDIGLGRADIQRLRSRLRE